MIRNATSEDIPRMVEMGQQFLAESTYSKFLSNNPVQMAHLMELILKGGEILVSEDSGKIVGMIGYFLHDHFISGEKFSGEVFWWVSPEYRGVGLQLLKTAEHHAKRAGAKKMQMIAPTKRVEAVYRYLGYDFV